MSGRIELREAVRRLREAADAAGHLGAGAGTEADRQVLRKVVRDVVREELAGLERPDGTVSRLSGLERRLERLEARRPSGTAMFLPTAPGPEHRSGGARQVRHPVRATKVAVSALVVLLLLGLAWLLVE